MDWQHLSVDDLDAWPMGWQRVLRIGIIGLATVLGSLLFLSPRYEALQAVQAQGHTLAEQQAQRLRQVAEHRDQQQPHAEQHTQTLAWQSLMPPQVNLPALLAALTELGQQPPLQLRRLKTRPPESVALYTIIPLELAVAGPYPDLVAFVHALSRLPGFLTLHRLQITTLLTSPTTPLKPSGGPLILEITAHVHQQNPVQEVPAP